MGIELVQQIISILIAGITGLAEGIGSGLSALVQNVFLTTTTVEGVTTTSLSAFGVVTVVFAAISLAIGLSRLVVSWLGSLGGRNV